MSLTTFDPVKETWIEDLVLEVIAAAEFICWAEAKMDEAQR